MKQTKDLFPGHILEDKGADRILRSCIGNYLSRYGVEMMRDFIDPLWIFGDISEGVFKYYVFPKGDEESEDKDCTFKKKDSRKIADRLIAFDKTIPAMKEATKIIADYLAKNMKQKEIIASALCALGEADGGKVSNIQFSPGTKDEVEYTLYKGETFRRMKCQWKDIFSRDKDN